MIIQQITWLIFCFLIPKVFSKGGGGSGGGRGFSAARSSVASSSGTQSNRAYGLRTGYLLKPGFSTVGSAKFPSAFGAAVASGTGGYLAAKGAHSHVILNPQIPMIYGGRSYYWDRRYYNETDELPQKCISQIDRSDPYLGKVTFENGTHPTEIVYGCKEYESCYGHICIDEDNGGELVASLFLMVPVAGFVVCVCIAQCRARFKKTKIAEKLEKPMDKLVKSPERFKRDPFNPNVYM